MSTIEHAKNSRDNDDAVNDDCGLAGCAGSDVTDEDVDAAREEGRLAGIAEATPVSTLDTIHERGTMKCGVRTHNGEWASQMLMEYVQELDIEYCKAVAAAIGLDAEQDVEYILASAGDRFEKLASGEIDVLVRTTTLDYFKRC